jgi:NAD(P)-dependent dehydrogenase (short-subunit alcohol dehydrogenase family)
MPDRQGSEVAVVTGAAAGIGRAVARRLGADGGTAIAAALDVRSEDAVRQVFDQVQAELGTPGALVSCAGILQISPALELSADDWKQTIDVNLTGTFLCTQIVVEGMKARRYGRIVNIGSLAGKVGGALTPYGQMGSPSYAASKGGVMAMTKNLAKNFGPYGITINALAPGPIWTPMIESVNPDLLKFLTGLVPLGRLGQPEDVAHAAAFLASDEASWITGHWLDVDGGMLTA